MSAPSQAIPLLETSEEYTRVKFLLQLSLRSTAAQEVRIWKVDNPAVQATFEKRSADSLCLDSWVDTTMLDEQNSVQNIFTRGFKFPDSDQGVAFATGNIQLNPSNGGAHQFLYCSAGVGRSFVMDDPNAKKVLPKGYDSVYVQRNLDMDGDGKLSMEEYEAAATHGGRGAEEYRHEYMLLDQRQVMATHLVEFFFDPASPAAAAVDDRPDDDPDKIYDRFDFFDPILYRPVSFRDKMVGSHSHGEVASHKLISIKDAYDTACAASQKEDPVLSARSAHIGERLRNVDLKLREVNKNSAAVEEQIYQMLQDALFELQDETQRKVSMLLGEEIELRRQQEQVQWMEDFLVHQREQATQVDFLAAWKHHLQLRDSNHDRAESQASVLQEVAWQIN